MTPRQIVADACKEVGIYGPTQQRGDVVDVYLHEADEINRLPAAVDGIRTFPRVGNWNPDTKKRA